MKIGIVGLGVVGAAIKEGFEKLGHEILCHDLKLNTEISDIVKSEIVFICVPTPLTKLKKPNMILKKLRKEHIF